MSWQWLQPISEEIFNRKSMTNESDESIEQVFDDISKEVSSVEKEHNKWKEIFYNEMNEGKFIPAGRILAGARPYNHRKKNLLNCYTIEVPDSMEGITKALQDYMRILSKGGGVGMNISSLRPNGAYVSSGGETSGPLSFLEIFDQASKTISLGGGRRGASIAILNVDHPDIEDFITYKQGTNNNVLTQFNISVGITDKFIKAAKNGDDWNLQFDGKVYKTVKADYLYDILMRNAYEHNEPGIFNLDHVNKYNNGYYLYDIMQPNPCSEQPLPPYGACDLGALNLTQFVQEPFTDDSHFDFESFRQSITRAVRFLDNVLDCTEYPLPSIEERVLSERRIGLGFTGLGDAFSMLKMAYNSKKAYELAEKIGQELRDSSYLTSIELAEEKGAFPNFDKKILKSNFIKNLPTYIRRAIEKKGLRNIACNTVAPVGTTSLSVGQNCSSGIEPAFSVEYERTIRKDKGDDTTKQIVYDYAWLKYMEFLGYPEKEPKKPNWFSTVYDLKPSDHIKMQGIFQKYIDASISKTINLPKETTLTEYKDIFMQAYDWELKGTTTFYEGGSIPGILSIGNTEDVTVKRNDAPKRPKSLPCDIHEIRVNKERHIVLCGFFEGRLYEIFVTPDPDNKIDISKHTKGFINKIKKGQYELIVKNGEDKTIIENIGKVFDPTYGSLSRFISMGLRHGVSLQFIVDQLQKDSNFISFERAVSRVLKRYIKDGEKSTHKCEECGSTLEYREGCMMCPSCGASKCS